MCVHSMLGNNGDVNGNYDSLNTNEQVFVGTPVAGVYQVSDGMMYHCTDDINLICLYDCI
jgi:hypothetical protein